jgi:phage replication-related protein YjqB (UPF0714/DUF867 family)
VRKDKYPNFKALEAAEKRGEDYEIVSRRVNRSPAVLIAPHGGIIEPFTHTIADSIAGQDFSFYAFRGLKPPGSRLHITSTNFDEPLCVDLVTTHERALAIHGWGESGERMCIGGRDNGLVAALTASLVTAGIKVEDATPGLGGTESHNIVNRCRSARGVQLELTMALRKNTKSIDALIRAVRCTLKQLPQPGQK